MTIEENIEVLSFVNQNIGHQFELWITITFAVIIASYIAGHRLTKILRYGLAALYTMVSILLYLVLVATTVTARAVIGDEISIFNFSGDNSLIIVIAYLRAVVWILGTIVTLGFILSGFKERDN